MLRGRGRLPREAQDVALLALAAVLVPATWHLLLGWSWGDLIPGHDGVATVFLAIRELVEADGRWSDLVYRADLFGGMKVRDAVGPLPALALLARLPLSPTAVFNVLTFLIQIVIAFLGVRTAQDLAAVLAPGSRPATWLERAMGVWLCAFAPALAWRLGYGHHTLVVGGLPFVAALALLAASGAGHPQRHAPDRGHRGAGQRRAVHRPPDGALWRRLRRADPPRPVADLRRPGPPPPRPAGWPPWRRS